MSRALEFVFSVVGIGVIVVITAAGVYRSEYWTLRLVFLGAIPKKDTKRTPW